MTKWIGAAGFAAVMTFGHLLPFDAAQAASATDPGARKYAPLHQRRIASRPAYPTYYGRPVVYTPAPFFPLPPLFGYGWEWW